MSYEPREDLSRQALGRPLTVQEIAFSEALGDIFASGQHDLSMVPAELEKRGVARPSGESGAWTAEAFEAELKAINASLDAAHEAGGQTLLD